MAACRGRVKITSFDPPLLAILTSHTPEPLQAWPALFDPLVQMASRRPGGHLYSDRRVDFVTIRFAYWLGSKVFCGHEPSISNEASIPRELVLWLPAPTGHLPACAVQGIASRPAQALSER